MGMKEYLERINEDYANALVHLVCLNAKQDKSYSLVFGLVEFYPKECASALIETNWQTLGLKEHRLFYRRKKLSVQDGLEFYGNVQVQNPFTFIWETQNTVNTENLLCDSLFETPYLSHHSKLPFIPMLWGTARVHSMLPKNNSVLLDILSFETIATWLEERLCFQLMKDFPELVGSMHCCLPNPLYRSCRRRLIPDNSKTPPKVQFHFIPRENCIEELNNLILCQLEKRPYGYAGGESIQVQNEYTVIPLIGGDEKVGSIICCPQRGLLDYIEFTNFIHEMHVDMRIQEGTIQHFLNNEITNTRDMITVKKEARSSFTCGLDEYADTETHDLGKRIRRTLSKKEEQKQARALGQFLCNNPEESRNYVTDILNRAISRVIIIDSYFDPEGLFHYIASIKLTHIVPEIIVSAEALKQEFKKQEKNTVKKQASGNETASHQVTPAAEAPGPSNADIFEQLMKQEPYKGKLTVSVMPGMGKFHDRFLIVDNEVWFSGNSLNNLGHRLSVIIRLPDAEKVLSAMEALRDNDLKPFADWLAKHRQAKNKEEGECHG